MKTAEVQCPFVKEGRCSTVAGLQRTVEGNLVDGVYAHLVLVHKMEQQAALDVARETVRRG